MTETVEVVVIGAGVVGLAVARAVAASGREVIVLERHRSIGQETSSRNSGVIHSGIYYPVDSLKARLCARGRDLLYRYCAERGVAHSRLGKIIVAQQQQIGALQALRERGIQNGVSDLEWLDAAAVTKLEPAVRCAAALLSPSTGIIDVHEYMTSLWGDLERAQGEVAFDCELLQAAPSGDSLALTIRNGTQTTQLTCGWLINAAGLNATGLLHRVRGYPPALYKPAYFAKGNYFSYRGRSPFERLVYPMPGPSGLGIHATLDLDGRARFGPDVEWIAQLHYDVDASRVDAFYQAIREYWPAIAPDSLQPAYAGVRPKLVGPNAAPADFLIEGESTHSVRGLINLLGIESPGLTSSLAMAEHVLGQIS